MHWAAPVLMAAVAVCVVFNEPMLFTGNATYGFGPDAPGTLWMYDWVKEDVLSGKFPIHTTRMYYPEGITLLFRNGSNVLDAFLSVPFQLFVATPLALVLTTVLIVAGNGLAIQPLLRHVAPNSAVVRGAVGAWWMINPYVLDEIARGRPTQAMLWFVPPAFLAMLRLSRPRDAVLLGLSIGLSALTYWYMALFLALALAPLAVQRLWQGRWRALALLSVAAAVALLVVAPLAVPILGAAARGQIPGLDLPIQKSLGYFTAGLRYQHMWALHANPLVAAALVAGVATLRRHAWAVAGIALAMMFALGARIPTASGIVDFAPYTWMYEHSTFIARLNFPERAYSVVYALLAVILAGVLDRARGGWVGWVVWVFVIAWPFGTGALPLPLRTTAPLPASVLIASAPGPVLVTPTESTDNVLIQQGYFNSPLVSGMGDHEPTVRSDGFNHLFKTNTFFTAIMLQSSVASWPTIDETRLARTVRWVWYDSDVQERLAGIPTSNSQLERLTSYMGAPYYADEMTVLWDLRRPGKTATDEEKQTAARVRAEYLPFARVADGSQEVWRNY